MKAGRWLIWGLATQVPLAAVVALAMLFPGTWVYVAVFLGGPVIAGILLILLIFFGLSRKWPYAGFVLLMPLGVLSGYGIVSFGIHCSDWTYFQLRARSFETRVAGMPFRQDARLAVLDSAEFRQLGPPMYRTILYYAPGQDAELSQDAVNAFLERKFFSPGNCAWNQEVRAMGNSYYIGRGFCQIPLST